MEARLDSLSPLPVRSTKAVHRLLRCCNVLKKTKIRREQLKVYLALFMAMFGSSFTVTMLFPFLPFMVQFLLPDIDASSIGKYAGMVASAMFLGRFIGSYTWGALSDSFGYKPILIISSLLLGLMSVLFGLSVNFPMAVATRLLVGLVNGVVGNAKAAMSANCDNSNQAFGMSILASSFGVGIIIGPAISGVIADPIGQYNWNITDSRTKNFLTKFPYSPPCFFNALVCFSSALLLFILLPKQPRKNKPHSAANGIELTNISIENNVDDDNRRLLPEEDINRETETAIDSPDSIDCTPYAENGNVPNNNTHSRRKSSFVLSVIKGRATLQYVKLPRWSNSRLGKNGDNNQVIEHDEEGTEELPSNRTSRCSRVWWMKKMKNAKISTLKSLKTLKILFSDPATRMALLIYCIYSSALIGYDEVYSLWCATPTYLGGIGFSLNQIGTSLSIVGVFYFPFSLALYPFLERKLGTLKAFIISLNSLVFLVILLPNTHFLASIDQPIVLWMCLCAILTLIRIPMGVGVSSTSLLINNSVSIDKLGSVNGLAIMLTSAFRFFSPLFAGSVYSASLSEYNQSVGFPIDYHLTFIILGLIFLLTLLMITSLPQSINRQKVVVVQDTSATGV